MLSSIQVRNLAVVEKAAVDFGAGLNVITGETGAGKSIIMGALSLVLGERADKTLLRTGETECVVEASFDLPDPSSINAILEDLAICDFNIKPPTVKENWFFFKIMICSIDV